MSTPTDPTLSPGRRRAFLIATALVPVLFFAVLEGGLRLAGYGDEYPLFVEVEAAPGMLAPSRQVARRYFTRTASVPTPNPDVFPAEKAEGTFRIIAQGGSSAAGYPFYRGASFPQILGTRLRLAYPGRDIEVVNTAMAAVNSYTLLDLADEVIAQDPDAVVIYAGHNEYYGALGAASTESLGRSPTVVRAFLSLQTLRTVQLVRDVIGRVAALGSAEPVGRPPSNTLMARMIGEQEVPFEGETYQAGRRQFESNLDRLLAKYAAADVPVYVSTLASNEHDQRPFITAHAADADTAAWFETTQAGADALEAGEPARAVTLLRRALEIDPGAADAAFALGYALEAVGRPDSARAAFERARDLDALRFRAPGEFNDLIREVAARHGAVVVEGEAAFRAVSRGGVIGRRTMLEHLHPTLDGYGVLADAFFEAFVADRLLGDGEPRATPPGRLVRLVTPMDSVAGQIRVALLTAGWPFRPEESQPVRPDTSRTPRYVYGLAQGLLDGDPWLQTADSLATLYERDGRVRDALVTRRAVVQEYPFLAQAWSHLASIELRRAQATGRDDRLPYVAGLFEQALDRDARHVPALAMLGALALQAGDRPTALGYLERARAESPEMPQVLYNLSGAYLMEGRYDEAIELAERLVALEPGNESYRALLTGLRRDAAAQG